MLAAEKRHSGTKSTRTPAEVEAETQDEIDQIMSEIEELQQEMDAVATLDSTPKAAPSIPDSLVPPAPKAAAPAAAKPVTTETPAFESEPEGGASPSENDLALQEAALAEELEQDILKEFSGEGEEPWLEETLAQLKEEAVDPTLGEGGMDNMEEAMMEAGSPEPESSPEPVVSQPAPAPTPSVTPAPAPRLAPVPTLATVTSIGDPASLVEETVRELASEENSKLVGTGGSISMGVRGSMVLKLTYEDTGQSVWVDFGPDAIRVKLSDGTEFKVPHRLAKLQKVS